MTRADLFIEATTGMAELQEAFAAALGLRHAAVEAIMGGDDYPELGMCDAFVEVWPIAGDIKRGSSAACIRLVQPALAAAAG